jgi:spore maturation protein CgeB
VVTDRWEGLEQFFTPGSEILVARTTADALAALDLPDADLAAIAAAARARTLDEHTSDRRAAELLRLLERSCRNLPVFAQRVVEHRIAAGE